MIRLTRTILAFLALSILLTACGGGGGSGSSTENRPPTTVMPPTPVPEPTAQTQIGSMSNPVADPTPRVSYNDTAVSFDHTPGGQTAQSIVEYLRAIAGGGGPAHHPESTNAPFLATFPSPPTVRLASDTTAEFRAIATQAVANINLWLPYGKRLHIGSDVAPLTNITEVPTGQIFVDFTDPANWRVDREHSAGFAQSRRVFTPPPTDRPNAPPTIATSARIWVDPNTAGSPLTTTMHELLHTLGFKGHISPEYFPGTIMTPISGTSHVLPPIDGETLLAAYTRFDPDTHPDDISAATLGPWATETMHIRGDIPAADNPIAFGVSFRNGLAHPWARGTQPDSDIADNTSIQGSAEWTGTLLGFTSMGNTAAGHARIAVELTSMTGTADFTDIETWSAAPGTKGTGAHWGELAYSLSISGNSFRNTGGDSGTLHGAFVGRQHEGVAGTLEREDLTAAFGATRNSR